MAIWVRIFLLAFSLMLGLPAQRKQPSTECDIVARVNRDVITREAYSAALEDHREELVRKMERKGKTEEDTNLEFERAKSSVLDQMIDNLLIDQRANELGLEADPEVIKDLEDPARGIRPSYADPVSADSMVDGAIDWEQARSTHRRLVIQDAVIWKEVLAPIYQAITDQDRRVYYDNHLGEFKLPEQVSLSEIFLPFESHPEAQVELDAMRLLLDLGSGANFVKAVMENTPESRASRATRGFLGSFLMRDIKPSIAAAISSLNAGEVSEPVRSDDGYAIYRLDARTADTLRNYTDPQVQKQISRSITMSLARAARIDYITRLRNGASIDVCAAGH